MTVVFGLGNPGPEYEKTRHNVGAETLQRMAAHYQITLKRRCFSSYMKAETESVRLVFPLTFMNSSGKVVPKVVSEGDAVIVICDQMDLPPGRIRLRMGGSSSAGHNGLKSMMEYLPDGFARMYIGVGRPQEGVAVPDHVLSPFSGSDRILIDRAEEKAADILIRLLAGEEKQERLIQEANSYRAE